MEGGWPVLLYNHGTHLLVNCDFRDFYVKGRDGVAIHHTGKKRAACCARLIAQLQQQGELQDPGQTPRLTKFPRQNPPQFLASGRRDVYRFLYSTALAGMLAAAAYLFIIQGPLPR
jgi:hypothetical protein